MFVAPIYQGIQNVSGEPAAILLVVLCVAAVISLALVIRPIR